MHRGFLGLFEANDLFNKLKHDFEVLNKNPADIYNAYNFFVTAEHLPDWVENTKLKDGNPYLRICSHLATGAKHFIVTNPKKDSIESLSVDIYVEEGDFENGYIKNIFLVELSDKEINELGIDRIEIMNLATNILSFWNAYFDKNDT